MEHATTTIRLIDTFYTGLTFGEYYGQMGFHVLLLADSTSRWAQAMRETSGRLEEIPGEEAFPAYLDSTIRSAYERAGLVRAADGAEGSLTMIGTVSPAGSNLEKPVTQSTLATVKCFLGLSYERAYKRFYPAVDPLISWSRYLEQLSSWFAHNVDVAWVERVLTLKELLEQGQTVQQMMQVTGEEGVTIEDYVTYQKSLLLDMVFLQQDAFDRVDASVPLERQQVSLARIWEALSREYVFADTSTVHGFFTRLTGLFRNFNYIEAESPEYWRLLQEIDAFVAGAP